MNAKKGKLALKVLMVGLLASTVWGTASYSQSAIVASGKFTLDFNAQWGKLDLQPGTYTFAVKAENSSYIVALQQGQRPLGFVLTSNFASQQSPDSQDEALLCVRRSGECSVGALKMPTGVFYFDIPGIQKAQLAQQPDLIERVPVLYAEK